MGMYDVVKLKPKYKHPINVEEWQTDSLLEKVPKTDQEIKDGSIRIFTLNKDHILERNGEKVHYSGVLDLVGVTVGTGKRVMLTMLVNDF